MTGKFVSSWNDIACDGEASLKLEDLSIDLVSLNNRVLDPIKDRQDFGVRQNAGNLKKIQILKISKIGNYWYWTDPTW